jgi:hypothetical protein
VPVKVSRSRGDPALETFIHGLITQEFDGAEPPGLILQGLGTYVRAIGRPGCDLTGRQLISLDAMVQDASRAVAASRHAWNSGNADSARLLIAAARSGLGLIGERYDSPDLTRGQQAIRKADRDLMAIQQHMDGGAGDVLARITAWQHSVPGWSAMLKRDQGRSLFEPNRLRRSLQR